jgi:copper transport protein
MLKHKAILWPWLVAILASFTLAQSLWAHAVLDRSEPAANASLAEAPAEIRLWFTEPLEPAFSSITLRDSNGATVETPGSQIDPADPYQMVLPLDALPDGLYTVVWQVVSNADGHPSDGSFPFVVGNAAAAQAAETNTAVEISLAQAVVRWFNLLGLALAVGSVSFVCFVWQPVVTRPWPKVDRRLQRIIWIGWLLAECGAFLILAQQTATMANLTLTEALGNPAVGEVIKNTRFGMLWSARMAAWALMGGMLVLARGNPALRWVALAWGVCTLFLHSLYSHAAGAQDVLPAVVGNWLHLTFTAFWAGGLVQLFMVTRPVMHAKKIDKALLGNLVGYFSNHARIAVGGLMVTGLYATWLHIGSLEGLLTTVYGQTLLVKLALIAPLLLIAAVNLVWTQRRLRTGQAVWAGRLRGLIGAEIVLLLAVLGAVGVLTSIRPARVELAQRAAAEAAARTPEPQPIREVQVMDNLQISLTVTPGWVGENTFSVALSTLDNNQPVTDASLIRMRFEHQTEDLGRSELRITEGQAGLYSVTGANLGAPGDWQIRMTVQRPEQYDTVVDFMPSVKPQPPPPAPPLMTPDALPYRTSALLFTGLLALTLGGYALGLHRFRFGYGVGALGGLLIAVGGVFLASALLV